jgi:hypothetical protein
MDGEGIRLVDPIALVVRLDVVLVDGGLLRLGYQPLPDTGVPPRPQRMRRLVPAVEVAHDVDGGRVGSPDREVRRLAISVVVNVGAELFMKAEVAPFIEQVDVIVAQMRGQRRVRGVHPSR